MPIQEPIPLPTSFMIEFINISVLLLNVVPTDGILENVEFKNVILKNNSTAIESDESNATFENCLFYSNNWEHFNRGNHIFMNCTFFENSGYFTWWNNGSLQVINSILWQNSFSFSSFKMKFIISSLTFLPDRITRGSILFFLAILDR